MSRICSVICGSPEGNLIGCPEGLIICADRGYDIAAAAGVTPDIVVGDFDSTDTILACDTAIEEGCDEIRLYCATGGRPDHTIANIQTLEYLRVRGVHGIIIGDRFRMYLVHEREEVIPAFSGYVSVFSYGETCMLSEYGMKYNLVRYRLDNAFPLGVSNEVAESEGHIIVHGGTALVVEYHN